MPAVRRLWIGSLTVAVAFVPAAFAQNSHVVNHGNSAGTGIGAEERHTHPADGSKTGISVAVPVGRVGLGPDFVDGAPVYVRRTKVREGMTIVEVSTTPFQPVVLASEAAAEGATIRRPEEMPASW